MVSYNLYPHFFGLSRPLLLFFVVMGHVITRVRGIAGQLQINALSLLMVSVFFIVGHLYVRLAEEMMNTSVLHRWIFTISSFALRYRGEGNV